MLRAQETLAIDFPAYKGEPGPQPISWDEFFERFENQRLALDYEEGESPGGPIRVWRLVQR